MQKKWISAIIITSICVAIIVGIGTYYWILNNEDKSDDDDDNSNSLTASNYIIDHNCAHLEDLLSIPEQWITAAKNNLHIAYWHTSHGSQLTTGMAPLGTFMDNYDLYEFNSDGSGGALHLYEVSDD